MIKKMFVSLMVAMMLILAVGNTAQAKEVRSTSASAVAEDTMWRNYLNVWTQTERGNQFLVRKTEDGFQVLFDLNEDLGDVEGVTLSDAYVVYTFDGMNNDLIEYMMKY